MGRVLQVYAMHRGARNCVLQRAGYDTGMRAKMPLCRKWKLWLR